MIVTIYKKTQRDGSWDWKTYRTKSLTKHHAFLAKDFDGQTWETDQPVITHFIMGTCPLPEPIVTGTRINHD